MSSTVPKWKRRLNSGLTTQVSPVKPGEHPTNCPLCRGSFLVWYVDRGHGLIQLPCPAFGGKAHQRDEI